MEAKYSDYKKYTNNTLSLSDRYISVSKSMVNKFVNHPNVVNIFVTGEAKDGDQSFARFWKETTPLNDKFVDMFELGQTRAKTDAEKAFFVKYERLMKNVLKEWNAEYEKQFGKISPEIAGKPMAHQSLAYLQNMLSASTPERLLVYMLTSTHVYMEAAIKIKRHPKYKPNPIYDFFYSKDFSPFLNEIKVLLNAVEDRIESIYYEASPLNEFHLKCLDHEVSLMDFV